MTKWQLKKADWSFISANPITLPQVLFFMKTYFSQQKSEEADLRSAEAQISDVKSC